MDEQQFERLFETIKSDSSLLSDINIDELLQKTFTNLQSYKF